jgi:hypothetical protein
MSDVAKYGVYTLCTSFLRRDLALNSFFTAPFALPIMWTELAIASWETVWHRTALMVSGECSPAEYESMLSEKMRAMQQASMALVAGKQPEDVLRPFHRRATANAERLRNA